MSNEEFSEICRTSVTTIFQLLRELEEEELISIEIRSRELHEGSGKIRTIKLTPKFKEQLAAFSGVS